MDAPQLSTTKLTNAVCSSAAYYGSKYETKHLGHGKEKSFVESLMLWIWVNKFFPMF